MKMYALRTLIRLKVRGAYLLGYTASRFSPPAMISHPANKRIKVVKGYC